MAKTQATRRVKRPAAPAIAGRDELEQATGEVARMIIERDIHRAEMEAAIQRVRETYEPTVTALDSSIEALVRDIQEYAESDRVNWNGRKSIEMLHAAIGFRTGQPRLALRRGAKWATVLQALKDSLNGRYLRVRETIDKDRLLAEREHVGADALRLIGVEVRQDESFYIEPRRESFPDLEGVRQ